MGRPPPDHGYRRLPGQFRGLFSQRRLWQGRDHLLLAETSGWVQSYSRFYFREIQALVIRTPRLAFLPHWIFSVSALLSLLWVLLEGAAPYHPGYFACGAALFFLLIYTYRGPAARCFLQTRIKRYPLLPLRCERQVRKFLERVVPLIEAAQESLGPAHGTSGLAGDPSPRAASRPAPTPVSSHGVTQAAYQGLWHGILFLAAIVYGLLNGWLFFHNHVLVHILLLFSLGALLLFTITALVKQSQYPVPAHLQRVTWCHAIYSGTCLIASYGVLFHLVLKNPGIADNYWALIEAAADMDLHANAFLRNTLVMEIFGGWFLGFAGGISLLAMHLRQRRLLRQLQVPSGSTSDHDS